MTTSYERTTNRRQPGLRLLVALVTFVALLASFTQPASAQTYSEGADYRFDYRTFPGGTLRYDWNIFGGAENLPYYINNAVLAAGFGPAVHSAFATFENDPGSKVSFVYMGATSATSELVTGNTTGPIDGINVVSFGSLSGISIGLGGSRGTYGFGPNGLPTNGSGQFDLTLRSGLNWSTTPNGNTVDVESVVLHELGHVLGLGHPDNNPSSVMHVPLFNGTTMRTLHGADRYALALMYPDGFQDVPSGAYYAQAVEWAEQQGITNGTSATTFSPNAPVSRAQMATFLWRYKGQPAAGAHPFTDVADNTYYTNAVRWLSESGITTGLTATTFGPDSPVTRGQMATFLWRYSNSPSAPPASGPGGFVDVTAGQYYDIAVGWMAQQGITTGTTSTTFSPNQALSRAQAVTFLWRHAGSP